MSIMLKKIYLVDSENVGDAWVELLNGLGTEDKIMVFYTDRSPHMKVERVRLLAEKGYGKVEWIRCFEGNNALDFQLVTELGTLIADKKADEYVIVSRDRGFEAVVHYWGLKNIKVSQNTRPQVPLKMAAPAEPEVKQEKKAAKPVAEAVEVPAAKAEKAEAVPEQTVSEPVATAVPAQEKKNNSRKRRWTKADKEAAVSEETATDAATADANPAPADAEAVESVPEVVAEANAATATATAETATSVAVEDQKEAEVTEAAEETKPRSRRNQRQRKRDSRKKKEAEEAQEPNTASEPVDEAAAAAEAAEKVPETLTGYLEYIYKDLSVSQEQLAEICQFYKDSLIEGFQELYIKFIKRYGQKAGLAYYKILKSNYRTLKSMKE